MRDVKETNSAQFTCKCGKYQNWISEGYYTKPCPGCGREYLGVYKDLSIKAIELKPRSIGMTKQKLSGSDWGLSGKLSEKKNSMSKPAKFIICFLISLAICAIGAVIQTFYLKIPSPIVGVTAFVLSYMIYRKWR